jgi:hypothetical protein
VVFRQQNKIDDPSTPSSTHTSPDLLEPTDEDFETTTTPEPNDLPPSTASEITTPPHQNESHIQSDPKDLSTDVSILDSSPSDNRYLKELESDLGPAFQPVNNTRHPTASIAHALMTTNPHINTPEPLTYKEAMSSPEASQWQQSVDNEFKSWIDNEVATIVDETDVPANAKLIEGRPVFKKKINELGQVVRYKCRGVAKGYTQRPGIDFHERESPVIRQSSLRTLLSIAASQDLEIQHGDIDTAFLVPTLKEAIYLKPIEGMNVPDGKVLKLLKCIYGLKQASREWYIHFTNILKSLGFQPTISDPCILTKTINKHQYYIGVYVDDFIVIGKDKSLIHNIFQHLEQHLKIKRLGDLLWILGMRVSRDRQANEIYLDQTTYVNGLIQKFNLHNANNVSCPSTDIATPSQNLANPQLYQSIVGSLQYASVCTRPDITFVTSKLSQFLKEPTDTHLKAAINAVKYLRSTKNAKLRLGGSNLTIKGYADAAYADNLGDRKSTTGHLITLGDGPIIWQTKKQPIVALSTTESEYIAATTSIMEIMWLRNFLQELELLTTGPTTLYQDNQSTIIQISKPVIHSRTRHLDVRFHFIKEQVQQDVIKIQHLPTNQMLADIFTKTPKTSA